jgi:hypothetical protein
VSTTSNGIGEEEWDRETRLAIAISKALQAHYDSRLFKLGIIAGLLASLLVTLLAVGYVLDGFREEVALQQVNWHTLSRQVDDVSRTIKRLEEDADRSEARDPILAEGRED